MWIRFHAPMDWKPTTMTTRSYKAGDLKNVTRACAEKALLLNKGVKVTKLHKGDRP